MERVLWLVGIAAIGCGGDSDPAAIDAAPGDAAIDGDVGVDAMPPRPRLMYVSANDESRLAVVELGVDGTMTAMTALDVDLPGPPTSMAYGRATRRLYVGLGNGGVATLDLDGDGAPALQAMITSTGNPTYIGLFENESVIATAYFGADEIQTHDVSGDAPHPENATLATAVQPHAAFPGPGGLIYVPHRDGEITRWFAINSEGDPVFAGELASEGAMTGPRHIAFSPDGAFAYIVNEFADTVSAHSVGGDGSLSRFQSITTLPAGADAGTNTGADIHVTPDGAFVYSSNRGDDSLAMFAVGGDGSLTPLGHVDTEAIPREFDVSPDGRFVVACGQNTGALQSYRIEADGTLTSVDRLQVAGNLQWVIID